MVKFGEEYSQYMLKTKMFFPLVFKGRIKKISNLTSTKTCIYFGGNNEC